MNRNKKLVAMLIGTLALTNTVMPVCAEPAELNMELAEDFGIRQNDTENVKKPGNLNLLDASVGLTSDINNMNNNKVAYQIQPGDTLSSIAKANKTTVAELIKDIGIKDPNKIKAGDIIISPHIKEDFVLSKGQDPKQTEKQYHKLGGIKWPISDSEREILRSLFNAEEYAKMYPDVAEECKSSLDPFRTFEEKLFDHFINLGIWESRQPSASFSVSAYASAYSDLKESFGSNIVDYYTHYYNTTVTGNENRTITTVQKAQDAGIKVTDFDGNTVAVDASGNIVTGEEADKIVAEKNLSVQTGPIETPIPKIELTFEVDEETKKEEDAQAPSSEEKEEPSTPVAPTKTYKEAYLEWLAKEPVGGSGNVYLAWEAKKPKLEDYADGRAFLAKKEAWEKEMPSYDAYLATTNYAFDYEKWKAKEPILADYTILVGNQTAAEKYEEDYAVWVSDAPKPEDYIKYTSFEADYNAWLAAAPVPVEGKYETTEKAMEAYQEAHDEWEAGKPKQSDYFDEAGYNKAVEKWNAALPNKSDYCNPEGYEIAVFEYEQEHPKPVQSTFFNEELYQEALNDYKTSNPEPQLTDYFLQENYTAAQNAYTEYCENLAAYEAYVTAKAEYDAAKSKWETDKAAYDAEVEKIEVINKPKREEYEAALAEYNKYIAYKNWEDATLEYYKERGLITYIQHTDDKYYYCYTNEYGVTCLESSAESALAGVKRATKPEKPEHYDTSNPVEKPTEPSYEPLPEGVEDPGEFTQEAPQAVEVPTPVDNPDEKQIEYLTKLAKDGNATDKASAESLFNTDHSNWDQNKPSSDDDKFYAGYAEALAEWEANKPKESDYYNNEAYGSLEAAKTAYEAAVADHEAAKPNEQNYVGEKAGDTTDKATALKAFEDDTASYSEEHPEPTEEEYTSKVITGEEKAAYDKAVEEHNADKPSKTDNKYVEEAKATKEYKDAVADHEEDKPDESTYVDDKYANDAVAKNAYDNDHNAWLEKEPSEESYIADTTYADDLGTWKESEPDVGEYFGIEVSK